MMIFQRGYNLFYNSGVTTEVTNHFMVGIKIYPIGGNSCLVLEPGQLSMYLGKL